MKNKVLIKVYVPEIDRSFDIYIPVNELVWKVKKMISKCISDLTSENFDFSREYIFINPNTNQLYREDVTILNTDIRNGTELILISQSNSN
jgi:hypothetical protein